MTFIEGDLLAADEAVIAHGCNVRGKFGKGFAGAVRERLPEAHAAYERAFAAGRLKVGGISWAMSRGRLVANCITQPTYGRAGTGLHVDYAALASCMRLLDRAGRDGLPGTPFSGGFRRVAMPPIGTGLGGADWARVSEIVEAEVRHCEVAVYCLPGMLPAWWPNPFEASPS